MAVSHFRKRVKPKQIFALSRVIYHLKVKVLFNGTTLFWPLQLLNFSSVGSAVTVDNGYNDDYFSSHSEPSSGKIKIIIIFYLNISFPFFCLSNLKNKELIYIISGFVFRKWSIRVTQEKEDSMTPDCNEATVHTQLRSQEKNKWQMSFNTPKNRFLINLMHFLSISRNVYLFQNWRVIATNSHLILNNDICFVGTKWQILKACWKLVPA